MDLLGARISGLDLFSGIGGISLALSPWVRPIAYCESDPYAQGVLLSRMAEGVLDRAPIWDDVTTLTGSMLPGPLDIIYGGFPCQDISFAGAGAGLAGKRSGLFFEIARLVSELRPHFVFLENVPAIRTRGADVIAKTLAGLGYDCRWTTLSAAEVGANHKRERWFLLAHTNSHGDKGEKPGGHGVQEEIPRINREDNSTSGEPCRTSGDQREGTLQDNVAAPYGAPGRSIYVTSEGKEIPNPYQQPLHLGGSRAKSVRGKRGEKTIVPGSKTTDPIGPGLEIDQPGKPGELQATERIHRRDWWAVEPEEGRVVNGGPFRLDRIKCLGNSVVPLQARTAFKTLTGME